MGCGASVPVPATDEQKREMMGFALKEMMIAVGTHAITNGKSVTVKAPLDELGNIRTFVENTRKAGVDANQAMSQGGHASGAAAALAEKAGGGMMGGMMGGLAKAAAVADQGLDKAADAGGSAAQATANAAADAMQKVIDELDAAFAKAGAEVTEAKCDAIIDVFKSVINDKAIADPQIYVRGASPHGPEEAAQCAKDAVSGYIIENAKTDMVTKMTPVCQEAVQASTACKTWKKLIDSYNSANEKLGTLGDIGKKVQQDEIKLDIETYIVEQIVLGYRELMATREGSARGDPKTVTVPKNTTTFVRCWDITSQSAIHYADFKKNHYDDFHMNGL